MGKLIKINNQQQTTGEIVAYFQEGFTIEPNSSISLLNMSCEMQDKNILVDATNNTFQRSVVGEPPVYNNPVVLEIGLYNLGSFVKELNRALNTSLRNIAGAEQGFQFKSSITTDNKLRISFNRIQNAKVINRLVKDSDLKWHVNMGGAGTSNNYKKTGTAPAGWTAGALTLYYFTGGAGAFSANITDLGDCIIGLTRLGDVASYSGVFDKNAYDFCVYIATETGGANKVYWTRYTDESGASHDQESAVAPLLGNIFGLMLSGGKLIYFAAPNGTDPVVDRLGAGQPGVILFEIDWKYDTNYYGMFSIYDTNQLKNVSFWEDPYHEVKEQYEHYHDEAPPYNIRNGGNDSIGDPLVGGSNSSKVAIDMPENVRNLFGFNTNPPLSGNVISGSFVGNRPFTNITLPQNMKILLDNLTIESYDNVTKQHESILATIPSLAGEDGKFIHIAPFLLNVELRNKYAINLSELRIRLVDFQKRLIKVKPDVTDITLFIS